MVRRTTDRTYATVQRGKHGPYQILYVIDLSTFAVLVRVIYLPIHLLTYLLIMGLEKTHPSSPLLQSNKTKLDERGLTWA